ncbi:MAG: hypothetical protein HZA60_05900 [Deltaproteobacteria bacterium]|nr:hypothetical protein [Deltaproteobacteria bacterium]
MRKSRGKKFLLLFASAAALGWLGCATADVKNETVASVNGDEIKVAELREFLGIRGGRSLASQVPAEKKKEALDRMVAGRLLAQDAKARGLDNTGEFREALGQNEQGVWITALFRKEMEAKGGIDEKAVKAEAKKLREADKNLSEADASLRAGQMVSEAKTRKIEGDLIAAAKKEMATSVNQEVVQKIGKGEKVEDSAILGSAGAEKLSYGEVKRLLAAISPGPHGGQDLSRNPVAIQRMLDREMTGRALVAYAKKQGIEGSEWLKAVRKELERSLLVNLLGEKVVLKEVSVTDKEISDAYAEHGQMFIRDGKKVPLAEVKEQIRGFLQNSKRRKSIADYIAELKKKAKITVNEGLLPKV